MPNDWSLCKGGIKVSFWKKKFKNFCSFQKFTCGWCSLKFVGILCDEPNASVYIRALSSFGLSGRWIVLGFVRSAVVCVAHSCLLSYFPLA